MSQKNLAEFFRNETQIKSIWHLIQLSKTQIFATRIPFGCSQLGRLWASLGLPGWQRIGPRPTCFFVFPLPSTMGALETWEFFFLDKSLEDYIENIKWCLKRLEEWELLVFQEHVLRMQSPLYCWGSNSTLQVRCLLQLSRFQVHTDMSVNFNVWRDGNQLQVAGGNIHLLILLFDSCGTWEHETDLKPLALGRAEGSFTKCGFVLEQNADSLGRLPWQAETKKGTFFHSLFMYETSFGHLLLHTPFLADFHAKKFHNQPTTCKPNHVQRLSKKHLT